MVQHVETLAPDAHARADGGALVLAGVTKTFGGVRAVDDLDLTIAPGSAVALIGPNGAGKSTVLKTIAGIHRPTSGTIHLGGLRLDQLAAHRRVHQGVSLAHQIPRPFRQMTVRQNVQVAAAGARRGASVDEVLERTDLMRIHDRPASSLGILDLKRIEVARALAAAPQILMLDEIAAGLVGRELERAIELVASIHRSGVSVLLVEHVASVVRSLVSRVVVLDWGELIAEGTPAQIAGDARVREVYLGSGSKAQQPPSSSAATTPATPPPGRPLLQLTNVSSGYAGQVVLRGIDLEVREGQVVTVLGANGAGKSTLCSTISGLVAASGGSIGLGDDDITTAPAHVRNHHGVAHCPEGRRLFADLTVQENLALGAPLKTPRPELAVRLEEVLQVFPAVKDKIRARAGSLSGGQQQMVAIGRALMSRPRLLVCDEVSLGLSPKAVDALYEGLEQLRDDGRSLLLVEQSVARSLSFAGWAYVLNRGQISFSGDPSTLLDPLLLDEAYFGEAMTTTS